MRPFQNSLSDPFLKMLTELTLILAALTDMAIDESRDRKGTSNDLTRDWTHNEGNFPSFIDCVKRLTCLLFASACHNLASQEAQMHRKLPRIRGLTVSPLVPSSIFLNRSMSSFRIAVRPKLLWMPEPALNT